MSVRWIATLDDLPPSPSPWRGGSGWGGAGLPWGPVVWIARHAEAERQPLPPPEPADLADAALARREGGAGRILRRRILRALVGRVFAVHPASVAFTRDASGAPGLTGLAACISTAGCRVGDEAWSAVALSPTPVGVDLEAVSGPSGRDAEALARWTLTEAYLKALGHGLITPPERVRLEPADGAAWRLCLPDAPSGIGTLRPDARLVAAAVSLP